jgi:GTPase
VIGVGQPDEEVVPCEGSAQSACRIRRPPHMYTLFILFGVFDVIVLVAVIWLVRRLRLVATSSARPFRMTIDDVFAVTTSGSVVVVGVISEGEIRPGNTLYVQTESGRIRVTVQALESFHQPLRSAKAGDRVGIMLVGASKAQIHPQDVLLNGEQE